MVDNPIQILATRLGCVTGLGELLAIHTETMQRTWE